MFFSLILLLLLSLITTMLESARVAACNAVAKSAVGLSTKSLLSAYYLPLYENYHVFGYWNEDGGEGDYDSLTAELKWYLQQNTESNAWLDIDVVNAAVKEGMALTEHNGAFFYEQVLQYSKYQGVELAAEQILEALGVLSRTDNTAYVLQKKYEAETCAAKAENTVLLLAGCIDGFVVEDGFFRRNWLGRLKTSGSFVKKLVPGLDGPQSVYLENTELYKVQKNHYEDPLDIILLIQKYKKVIEEAEEALIKLSESARELETEYQNRKDSLPEDDASLIRLQEQLEEIQKSIADYQKHRQDATENCNAQISTLKQLVEKTKGKTVEALELLCQIKEEKKAAQEELTAYMQELESKKEQLEPELYEELQKEGQELCAEYQKENSISMLSDISAIEEALYHNQSCLEAAANGLQQLNPTGGGTGEWDKHISMAEENLQALSLGAFQFQYDNLFAAKQENGFTGLAGQLMEYGVLALVLEEPEAVSEAYLSGVDLPSAGYGEGGADEMSVELADLLSGEIEAGTAGYGERAASLLSAGMENLLEELLYQVYLMEHFPCYIDFLEDTRETDASGKVEGLLYQTEYIINGKEKDSSNLAAMAGKILFLRFMLNLTGILCSSEARTQAKGAATAIIGFTGISALVSALQFLIELIWAAECALTECAALFMGGECAFFVSGSNLAVAFSELLAFNKATMLAKAETMKEKGVTGLLKNYEGYLILFLLFQEKELRTLRTMDVIQQVMQINYASNFRFADCIGKVDVEVEFEIPYRFLIYDREERAGKGLKRVLSYEVSY